MKSLLSKPIKLGRSRPTASMVVAVVALVFATTGGALASSGGPTAQAAKHKSVSAQIKAYFKKHKASLTGPPGPAGPQGPQGAQGATGPAGPTQPVEYVVHATVASGATVGLTSTCPSGQVPTGGGAYDSGDNTAFLYGDGPSPGSVTSGTTPTGWGAQYFDYGGSSTTVYVYAICVPSNGSSAKASRGGGPSASQKP